MPLPPYAAYAAYFRYRLLRAYVRYFFAAMLMSKAYAAITALTPFCSLRYAIFRAMQERAYAER